MDNSRNDRNGIERYEPRRGCMTRQEIPVADYEFGPQQEINLKEYWEKIRRRKRTVFSVAAVVFVLTAFWTFVQRPV